MMEYISDIAFITNWVFAIYHAHKGNPKWTIAFTIMIFIYMVTMR